MKRAVAVFALAVMGLVSTAWVVPARADDAVPEGTSTEAPADPSATPEPSSSVEPSVTPTPTPTPATLPPPPPAPAPKPKPKPKPVPQTALVPVPPGVSRSGDLIEISIPKQTLTAWRNGRMVMRFLISTGRPGYRTVKGRYRVISKSVNAFSRKWQVIMPWAMNWHGNYFIHQLPHYPGSKRLIGGSTLGKPASHGCVRVGAGNAEKLYRWAHVGTPVWVH